MRKAAEYSDVWPARYTCSSEWVTHLDTVRWKADVMVTGFMAVTPLLPHCMPYKAVKSTAVCS